MSQIDYTVIDLGDHGHGHGRPSQKDIDYGDSSWPLYAMYSKIVKEEDKKIAELHHKSVDGIMIFTGLFSVTVAVLLAGVSIPELRKPDFQETSAFYLENIFRLMSNASASNGSESIPSTLVERPASSPRKFVVWVNSLWLLALLISLSGAMWATIEQHCVLRHIKITQNKEYTPEMRARVHTLFSGRFNFRDTGVIIFCLHLSLFLFMAGVLIYFFNINRHTFYAVVWWIGIVTLLYIVLTVAPMIDHYSLVFTPATRPIFYLYHLFLCDTKGGFLEDQVKSAEEAALAPQQPASGPQARPTSSGSSQSIDAKVLDKILLDLDEDQALEGFFNAIPGFCDSSLVKKALDYQVRVNLYKSLIGFLDRTFTSPLVTPNDRIDRFITCLNAAHSALDLNAVAQILESIFKVHWDGVSKSDDLRHWVRRWAHSSKHLIDPNVRRVAACIIACAKDGDGEWTKLATEVLGVPEHVFQNYRPNANNVLLAVLIHVAQEALAANHLEQGVLEWLSRFDVHDIPPQLQHDFCTLWNGSVQRANDEGDNSVHAQVLAGILRPVSLPPPANPPSINQVVDGLSASMGQPVLFPPWNNYAHLPQ